MIVDRIESLSERLFVSETLVTLTAFACCFVFVDLVVTV